MATFAVILPAAGQSSRFQYKNKKKPFVDLSGRAVWIRAAEVFANRKDIIQTLVVISPDDREFFLDKFGPTLAFMGIQVVQGGKERYSSIANALSEVRSEADHIAIHDAVRPCIANEWIDLVFTEATKTGAAILGIPIHDTLKRGNEKNQITETVSREQLWAAQTPQVFRKDLLVKAYQNRGPLPLTDDAQLMESMGHDVSLVLGSPLNLKITTAEDLKLAEAALKVLPRPQTNRPLHPFSDDQSGNDLFR